MDTLKYSKKLIHTGVPRQQAEAQAEALAEIASEQLATKHDLKELEQATKRDLKELETKLENKIDTVKHNLMTQLGSLMVISISIATTIIGVLISIHN